MLNGIIYPFSLSAIKAIQNIFTKSELIDFIKLASNNSVIVFFIYKHIFKTLMYVLLALLIYFTNKKSFNSLAKLISNSFKNTTIYKTKKHWYLILIIALYGILEIINGLFYYNSLLHNNLNKFVIYIIVFSIIFNGIISYFIYNEKITSQLIFGYIICILGVAIVKFS